jgi:predicted DNA-binding protein (MmcQ/YjbR family)
MDVERLRTYLLTLPHVVETEQWGGLVFWVGDKAIGGKMFAMVRLEHESGPSRVISYLAGPERFSELLETEGVFPAPYVARIFWVAIERWDVFRTPQWEQELSAAHSLTLAKLPAKVLNVLATPATQQKRLVAERRKALATKAVAKAAKPRTP